MKLFLENVWEDIAGKKTRWLLPPDPTGENTLLAWTQESASPKYIFAANTNTENAIPNVGIPLTRGSHLQDKYQLVFSTDLDCPSIGEVLFSNDIHHKIHTLNPGEGRAYRICQDCS
jgi:hypothetical protein